MTAVLAPDVDELPEHLEAIAAGQIPAHVAAIVAAAPPLTAQAVEQIRALLRPQGPVRP